MEPTRQCDKQKRQDDREASNPTQPR